MPEPIVMKLGVYIMPPEAISAAYFTNSSISYTNITPSEIVQVKTLILLDYLNRLS
jgi:hypothetical protein